MQTPHFTKIRITNFSSHQLPYCSACPLLGMSFEGKLSHLKSLPNKNEHVRTKMNESNATRSVRFNSVLVCILYNTALFSTVYACFYRSRESSVSIGTGYGLDGRGSIPSIRKIFLFSIASRPALGPIQPPMQCVQWAISRGVKLTTYGRT
jgi:hypothetical protein